MQSQDAQVERLVAGHREFLAFLQRRVRSRELAEELLQEAFARGLAKIGTLRRGESAVAWFYRLLRRAIVDRQRRDGTLARRTERLEAELARDDGGALHAAVCACVKRLAGGLKPEYADALRRIEVDGVAVRDYAQEAGISRSNAAVRAFRAREALRREVVRSCRTCAEHGCVDCSCKPPPGAPPGDRARV